MEVKDQNEVGLVKDIIEFLEDEREALTKELERRDVGLNKDEMSYKEIDAYVLRKQLYALSRQVAYIKRLSKSRV